MKYYVELTENNKWVVEESNYYDSAPKTWAFSYASEVADFLNEQKKKKETKIKEYTDKIGTKDEVPF